MPSGDVYKIDTFFDFQGQTNNVYQWYADVINDATGGVDNETALMNYFETTVMPALVVGLAETFEYKCVDVKQILKGVDNELVNFLNRQRTVSIKGDETVIPGLPGQCSLVVQTLEDDSDVEPSRRGRDFFSGFPEQDQTDGEWTTGTIDRVVGQLKAVLNTTAFTSNGGDYGWLNWSPKLEAKRKTETVAPFTRPAVPIFFLRPLKKVRTQRRRQALNPCDKYGTVVEINV